MMHKKPAPLGIYREALYIVGLTLISIGTVLMAKSNLGISVTSAIPYLLWQIWPHISWGVWTYGFQTILILLLIAFLRRFKPVYVSSYAVAIAFSVQLDLCEQLLATLSANTLLERWLCYGSGLLVLQIGVAMMVFCGLPLMPLDIFVQDLAQASGRTFGWMKLVIDLIYVSIALLILFLVFRRWIGIGVGTLIAGSINGMAIGFWIRCLQSRVTLKHLRVLDRVVEREKIV